MDMADNNETVVSVAGQPSPPAPESLNTPQIQSPEKRREPRDMKLTTPPEVAQELLSIPTNSHRASVNEALTSAIKKKEAFMMGQNQTDTMERGNPVLRACGRVLNGRHDFRLSDFEDLLEQSDYRSGNEIPQELKLDFNSDSGFFFGSETGRIGYVGKRADEGGHILITGTPASGKTMGLVVPTLMTWRGSQVILDVKGDLVHRWKKANSHHDKKLVVFSPGSKDGCCYDPFAALRSGGSENLAGNARDLAMALLPLLPSVKDPIWIQTAQNFLTGAIIYHFEVGCTFTETMVSIQENSIQKTIEEILESKISKAVMYTSKLCDVSEKVLNSIGMELANLAGLVSESSLFQALKPHDGVPLLDWSLLNTETDPVDIILKIPEACLDRWKPLVLLMLNQLIKTLEQRPERTYDQEDELPPLLVMLDEFPRLGKISAIISGLSTLRSRGVTFALVIQSIANLEDTYGQSTSQVLLDLCAYKAVLTVSDLRSQQYFSGLVGTAVTTKPSFNATYDPKSGRASTYSISVCETREPIIYPPEFLTLKDVVLITPHGSCRAKKTLFTEECVNYYLNLLSTSGNKGAKVLHRPAQKGCAHGQAQR